MERRGLRAVGAGVPHQTPTLPSEAKSAETPGTPDVAATSPKLLARFGSADFDLNRATYTRYHFVSASIGAAGARTQPDAILVRMGA